jgi:heme-degrading monooxygenase HmoA
MFVIVWQFQVRSGSEAEFEQVYSSSGEWVRLFQQGAGFIRAQLLRDPDIIGRYLTLDHWESQDAFEQFRHLYRDQYEVLDHRCEGLTISETLLGRFGPVDQL